MRCFMKLLVIAAVFIYFNFQVNAAEKYKDPATGISFPDKVGDLFFEKVHDFEKQHPGLGVSLSYNAPGTTVTLYIYNLKIKSIPSSVSAPELKAHFKAVQGDIYRMEKRGTYKSVKKLKDESVVLNKESKRKALHAEFEYSQNKRKRISHIYLWGFKNNFIKIRYTYDVSVKVKAEKNLKKLLTLLGK